MEALKKIKLLLVDDDVEDRAFIKDLLLKSQLSFDIDEADSSNSALQRLGEINYDCVLIDYIIPGLSGLEVLKAARGRGKNVPFILVTGMGDWELGEELIHQGATDYVTKEALTLENLQYKINAIVSEELPEPAKCVEVKLRDGVIGQFMQSPPLSMDANSTINEVIGFINTHNVGALLVKENTRYVGIVTTRDLIRKAISKNLQRNTTKVSIVMTPDILSMDKNATVKEAYELLREKHIRHLAVTDNKNIVGTISVADLTVENT